MDFGSSGREGFNQEERIDMDLGICMSKGKLPIPYSSYSSSSSSPSSSFRHKSEQLASPRNSGWEEPPDRNHDGQHQMPSKWLGNRYEPEQDNTEITATAATITTATAVSEPDSKLVDLDSTRGLSPDIEKEHMFDKVVTPSDVGKLNRLVIPKQYAEKYFPLDSSVNEKGLLLNFEDRNGKPWRFRYSYWNSSQSYVITKGWSRFVKDKNLDAGDIVSFQRGAGEMYKDRLFIDWRRRPDAPADMVSFHPRQHHLSLNHSIPWSPMLMRPPPPMNYPLSRDSYYGGYPTGTKTMGGSLFYLRSPVPQMGMGMMHRQLQGGGVEPVVFDSVPVVQGNTAATKKLRLFGVNMECPVSESDECEMLPTTTISHAATMTSQKSQLSSSSHIHQLRLHHGTPLPPNVNKGKASLSFNFDTA